MVCIDHGVLLHHSWALSIVLQVLQQPHAHRLPAEEQRGADAVVAVAHEAHSVHVEYARPPPPPRLVQLRSLDLPGVQDVPLEFAAVDVRLAGKYRTHVVGVLRFADAVGVAKSASAYILHSSIGLTGLRSSVVLLSALSGAPVCGVS